MEVGCEIKILQWERDLLTFRQAGSGAVLTLTEDAECKTENNRFPMLRVKIPSGAGWRHLTRNSGGMWDCKSLCWTLGNI